MSEVAPANATTRRPCVLVVDDDADLVSLASEFLRRDGLEILTASDGAAALAIAADHALNLVLLDIGLPDVDGLSLLRTLRQRSNRLGVIITTARSDEPERVLGLELGADDYLVKPFSLRELSARARAVLRRVSPIEAEDQTEARPIRIGNVEIDTAACEARVGGRRVALTPLEYGLLAHLAASPGQTFSKEQLLSAVWESSASWQATSTVSEHVHRLRRKLSAGGASGTDIVTVRGYGYRIDRVRA